MLKNLVELGRDVKNKFENFNKWQEIRFNDKDKEELSKLDNVHTVFNHSIMFEYDNNHTIVPSQYILYALSIKDFALGLKEHLDIFDSYKTGKDRNQIGDEITNQSFDRDKLGLDDYSKTVLFEPLTNADYNFSAKSIINGSANKYKVRASSDFFTSVILKIINVPDASSSILGKLIYYLSDNPSLYDYLESRFIEYLPYLVQDSIKKTFARKTFAYLSQYDNLEKIKSYVFKNNDNSFSSIKLNEYSLTSIFKTSKTLLSENDLKQGNKLRYFTNPLFIIDDEFYYFSTEWTDGTDSRLDLKSMVAILNLTYPEFSMQREGSLYQLISSSIKVNTSKLKQDSFSIQKVISDYEDSGIKYSELLITRFISSLTTKPFVLLSGLSGSGKTMLAQSFAQWICEFKTQYTIVPVGADWTSREPLLGYVNALNSDEYVIPENGALQLIINAHEKPKTPHFLILDEMNLSHVERYFADFLSVMESNDKFKLHSDYKNLKSEVPAELAWPSNLFVIGTVNIDETTYMFSPKVLDRANVIEFRVNEGDMKKYLSNPKEIINFNGEGASMGESFVSIYEKKAKSYSKELNEVLQNFFTELQEVGAEFGYRTVSEIQTLFGQIDKVNPNYTEKEKDKIDIVIMQKLLPKLHGSRRKLLKTLNILAQKCLEKEQENIFNERGVFNISEGNSIKYKLSFVKIARMYKNAIDNGFASYAEA